VGKRISIIGRHERVGAGGEDQGKKKREPGGRRKTSGA